MKHFKDILEIKNLHVSVEGKEILKGINLTLESGKIYALMGPNGSGKSTLSNVLMGNPKYQITKGEILFNNTNINELEVHERAKMGIFLSFQYPIEIQGVSIINFLKESYNAVKKTKINILEFKKMLEKKAKELDIDEKFILRSLNEGLSGGEKKKSEILQMSILDPKLAVLDETDSGLDIDALKEVAKGVNKLINKEKTVLVITHYKRILEYIKPYKVFVMKNGKIIAVGKKELVEKLEKEGYKLFD